LRVEECSFEEAGGGEAGGFWSWKARNEPKCPFSEQSRRKEEEKQAFGSS